jgi:hypothetical protein
MTLAASANFSQTLGTLKMDIGTASDQIVGSGGTFSLTGGTLALSLGSGFGYANTYSLFSSFAGGTVSSLTISGYDTVNYTAGLGSDGVLYFTAIPEPSTYAAILGGLALAGVFIHRRRNRAGKVA